MRDLWTYAFVVTGSIYFALNIISWVKAQIK